MTTLILQSTTLYAHTAGRVVAIQRVTANSRVEALQRAAGVSQECAAVFVHTSAEIGAVKALARRLKVLA